MKEYSLTTWFGIFLMVLVLGGCTSVNTKTSETVFVPLVMTSEDCDKSPIKETESCIMRMQFSPRGGLVSVTSPVTGPYQAEVRSVLEAAGWNEHFNTFLWSYFGNEEPTVCSAFQALDAKDRIDLSCADVHTKSCKDVKVIRNVNIADLPAVLFVQEGVE